MYVICFIKYYYFLFCFRIKLLLVDIQTKTRKDFSKCNYILKQVLRFNKVLQLCTRYLEIIYFRKKQMVDTT